MIKRFFGKMPKLEEAHVHNMVRNVLIEGGPQTGKTECIEGLYSELTKKVNIKKFEHPIKNEIMEEYNKLLRSNTPVSLDWP